MKIAALLLAATAGAASAQIVDTFDIPDATAPINREVAEFATPDNDPLDLFNVFTDTDFLGGSFVFSSGPATSAWALLEYDNNGTGLNADLSGETAFEFDFNFVDLAFELQVQLESNGSIFTVTETVEAGSTFTESISFSSFQGIDFADVDRITINFNTGDAVTGLDFILTEFRTVPTPGAAALFGVAGLVAGRRRR